MSVRGLILGWLALALAAPGFAQGAQWSLEPSETRIGEPCRMRLLIEHDADDSVLAPPKDFETEGAAVRVLHGPAVSTVLGGRPGRAQTELVWTVMGVEPGLALAPELELELATKSPLEWGFPVSLNVALELGVDEDEPRPLPKPRGWAGAGSEAGSRAWMLGLVAAALLGGLLLAWRKCRGGSQAQSTLALEPPAEILARLLAEEAKVEGRDVGYGVTQALRGAAEELTQMAQPSLALDEWLDAQSQGTELSVEDRVQLAGLLQRAEALQFGPLEGRLSQRELLKSAQDLVGTLTRRKQELRS